MGAWVSGAVSDQPECGLTEPTTMYVCTIFDKLLLRLVGTWAAASAGGCRVRMSMISLTSHWRLSYSWATWYASGHSATGFRVSG